jgi:DNA-binding response OmpR family regulator
MPLRNGNEVCAWVRQRGLDVPILVLSAYDDEALKVQALDAGADDYVTKPFKVDEFLARLRALMRRATAAEAITDSHKATFEGISIDFKGRRAFVDGVDMHLTRTEMALLATLAEHVDSVLTHDELIVQVWGNEYRGSNHYLHVYLGKIRKKMTDPYSTLLETVAGIGYMLHSRLPV